MQQFYGDQLKFILNRGERWRNCLWPHKISLKVIC